MDSVDPLVLIEEVKKRPILWNKSVKSYREKHKSMDAWYQISSAMNKDFESMEKGEREYYAKKLMRKWANLRDNFTKAIRKSEEFKKHGYGTAPRPYIHNSEMSFLKPYMKISKYLIQNQQDDESRYYDSDGSDTEVIGTVPNVKNEKEDEVFIEFEADHDKSYNAPSTSTSNPIALDGDLVDVNVIKDSDVCRHMSFFKGILPSLNNLNDDETLEFQIGVLKIIKDIRSSRNYL